MEEAIHNRAEELGCPVSDIREIISWDEPGAGLRDRRGYRDTSPRLLPGDAFHERVASHGPDDDDESAFPGFRVQNLSQRIEHMANIKRPDSILSVGLVDQPSRKIRDIACLTAEISIGGSTAYILFDSGSNTDSLTPEFAKATNCKVFKLADQVTLQLGCVGSRSRINYGARAPVDFSGMKGHAYFDIVNLDRYDGIIGTPFMIKHRIVLDFGSREIRFPNGQVLAALALPREISLVKSRLTPAEEGRPASN